MTQEQLQLPATVSIGDTVGIDLFSESVGAGMVGRLVSMHTGYEWEADERRPSFREAVIVLESGRRVVAPVRDLTFAEYDHD